MLSRDGISSIYYILSPNSPSKHLQTYSHALPMSTTSPPESAAQRALRLPEIAALILDAIDQDVYARNGLNGDPSRFLDLIDQSSVDAMQLKRRAL
ncbi:hypothetical protein PG991_001652 [Apiospora marii]|uniref:Uncharacterized protein n=1 Tax=Apiospora marii TaxID=335849 RepID=A0ABR1SS04_9PEZI